MEAVADSSRYFNNAASGNVGCDGIFTQKDGGCSLFDDAEFDAQSSATQPQINLSTSDPTSLPTSYPSTLPTHHVLAATDQTVLRSAHPTHYPNISSPTIRITPTASSSQVPSHMPTVTPHATHTNIPTFLPTPLDTEHPTTITPHTTQTKSPTFLPTPLDIEHPTTVTPHTTHTKSPTFLPTSLDTEHPTQSIVNTDPPTYPISGTEIHTHSIDGIEYPTYSVDRMRTPTHRPTLIPSPINLNLLYDGEYGPFSLCRGDCDNDSQVSEAIWFCHAVITKS